MRILEVIVTNLQDAVIAENYGADRLELVSHMEYGGLSPDINIVKDIVENVLIPVNIMIRKRKGDFDYTSKDYKELKKYLAELQDINFNGYVFGAVKNNRVDISFLNSFDSSKKMTFHRAIESTEISESIDALDHIELVENILTNGTNDDVLDNLEELIRISQKKTRLLVGGGVDFNNIKKICKAIKQCDIHVGSAVYNNFDFSQGINGDKIKRMKKIINEY